MATNYGVRGSNPFLPNNKNIKNYYLTSKKINNFLYDLVGVKPVMTISRNYPFSDVYTHILGYVSQPNEDDILSNKVIQDNEIKDKELIE